MNLLRRSGIHIQIAVMLLVAVGCGVAVNFIERAENESLAELGDAIWWAFVTLTTVGYGDRVPMTAAGRVVAMFLAFFGIVMAAIFSARFASLLVELNLKEGRGMKEISSIRNHFVILGWKAEMRPLLKDLLATDPDLKVEEIVLVNNVDQERVDTLRSRDPYSRMHFIRGDFVEESVLLQAQVPFARRVLILASDIGDASSAEVDARTVMAVMTVNKLTREAYICAELLEAKFQPHLESSGCDEVILTRDSSRILLANASTGTGVSEIFQTLMSGRSGNGLSTRPFDASFVGKNFAALRAWFAQQDGSMLIGLVENTGNAHLRKREALREAQKTPDISELVRNLQKVKELVPNRPILNPPDDYVLPTNSLAILIQRSAPSAARK